MIKPEQIPDEVVDALWRDGYSFGDGLPSRQMWIMREAIAAALNAWPGSCKSESVLGLSKWIELPIEEEP